MKKYTDVMVDLETLGNSDSPTIIQLSAVKFNSLTGETFEEFSKFIDPRSCILAGLKSDGSTLDWWLRQDKKVFEDVVLKSLSEGLPLTQVLAEFSRFLCENEEDIRIWGNGIMSDNVWIHNAYKASGVANPIKFWQHSDVRTIVDLGRNLLDKDYKKEVIFIGDPHNAIDDCKHQIRYVCKIIEELKK